MARAAPAAAVAAVAGTDAAGGGNWYAGLGADGRRAFWAAFVGVALAAFDLFSFTYVLGAIRDDLGLNAAQVGVLASASLVAAAGGGILAGALADRIGRVRTIQVTIVAYAVGALLSGLSQEFWQLLLCRVMLGFGYGGDWGASSLLVAEYARPASRGRALGALTGAAPAGNILAALAAAALAATISPALSWRLIFVVGLVPAVLAFALRRGVQEPPAFRALHAARQRGATAGGAAEGAPTGAGGGARRLVGPEYRRLTLGAILLSAGAMSGLFIVLIWGPTFLRTREGLSVEQVSLAAILLQVGSWAGYMAGGYAQDALGRKKTFALFAALGALATWAYVGIAWDGLGLALAGIVVGFFVSGVVAGLGAYLAELFPPEIRGIGQGSTYAIGRGLAAVPVTVVGDLAAGIGLGRAMGFGAALLVLCLVALLLLPETKGKAL